jgi:FkbM family methyltransferase
MGHFKSIIKELFKNFFLFLGLKITRLNSGLFAPKNTFIYQFLPTNKDKFNWLKALNINTVIDVGAHQGEFSSQIYQVLPNAKFYCFEPLRNNFRELKSNLTLPNFSLFNLAMGDNLGKTEIHSNNFSPSSSLLKISKLHQETFPFSAATELETIEINTLDEIFKDISLEDNILLKIDVQGYEQKVLTGAKAILERVKVIIIETSFCELYEGQTLFADIYNLLTNQGFVYSGSLEELKSPVDGLPLQQDSLFIKL